MSRARARDPGTAWRSQPWTVAARIIVAPRLCGCLGAVGLWGSAAWPDDAWSSWAQWPPVLGLSLMGSYKLALDREVPGLDHCTSWYSGAQLVKSSEACRNAVVRAGWNGSGSARRRHGHGVGQRLRTVGGGRQLEGLSWKLTLRLVAGRGHLRGPAAKLVARPRVAVWWLVAVTASPEFATVVTETVTGPCVDRRRRCGPPGPPELPRGRASRLDRGRLGRRRG